MSGQSKFKIKRPHSPDHIGIHNYKKQRLLYDLENLSLHDDENLQRQQLARNSRRYPQIADDTSTDTVDGVYIPYTGNSHPLKLLQSKGSAFSDSDLVYHKIKMLASNDALRIIRWFDVKQLIYSQWFQWFQLRLMGQGTESNRLGLRENESFSNMQDYDGDIDMEDA